MTSANETIWKIIINNQETFSGLVVNEIMNNPSATNDSDGEWFEIVNTNDQIIDIYGLIIKDQDSDQHMINEHVSLSQNEFIVLLVVNFLISPFNSIISFINFDEIT